jgi:hypothetical protein
MLRIVIADYLFSIKYSPGLGSGLYSENNLRCRQDDKTARLNYCIALIVRLAD